MSRRHWIIPVMCVALLAGGLLWLLGRTSVQEGRCKLERRKVDPSNQLVGLALGILQPLPARPDSVRDLPAGFDRPTYYQIKSGDKLIPLVMNLSERPRLCLDTDGDGVLSRERCFAATRVPETEYSSSSWRFGPISLVLRKNSGAADSRFYVHGHEAAAWTTLTTRPAFFRTGRLRLDGRTYRVAVVDGNCDGQYHSILSLPLQQAWRIPASDVFAIDLNVNGGFEISSFARSEVVPLGRLVRVDDDYYAVDVALGGESLMLVKVQPPFGTLAIESGDASVELKLWSDAADQYLSPGHQWQLPAGKYMATYAALEQRDAAGYRRTLSCVTSSAIVHLGPLHYFEIKPGEATSLRIGAPFTVKTDVQPARPGEVTIGLVLVGCAGEEYQVGGRRGGADSPRPSFQIVDEKGTVLVADKFQYG